MKLAYIELLHITNTSDQLIELAGRTCYQSYDKITDESTQKFVEKLNNNKHLSVIEHATATIKVSNISRVLTHQLVRHRLGSYSQQSQRCVPTANFGFIRPPDIAKNPISDKIFHDCITSISTAYNELLALGIKKEDCRYLLPNAACTEIVITFNFRQWKHFFDERLSKGAQWEIKAMAIAIYDLLASHSCCFDNQQALHNAATKDLMLKHNIWYDFSGKNTLQVYCSGA